MDTGAGSADPESGLGPGAGAYWPQFPECCPSCGVGGCAVPELVLRGRGMGAGRPSESSPDEGRAARPQPSALRTAGCDLMRRLQVDQFVQTASMLVAGSPSAEECQVLLVNISRPDG